MAEELVDVINDQNKVIKTVPKSVAHRDGLLHRIVIAELKNSKGEYCFVKQADDRQDPGQFVSPVGGHVTAGDTVEMTLIREAQEEIGITPTKYHFVDKLLYVRDVIGRHESHLFFVYEIETDEEPILNHESVEYRWFSVDEIKQTLKTNPNLFGAAWHHVFNNLYPQLCI